MNIQARRIAEYLHAKREDDIASWLTGLRSLLAAEASLNDDTVAALVDRARPRWGVKSLEEARAYVELWDWLVERFPVPALIGARSDVLYLLGGLARRNDVLVELARAVKAAPELFAKYAGDFSDLAENSALLRNDFSSNFRKSGSMHIRSTGMISTRRRYEMRSTTCCDATPTARMSAPSFMRSR